MLVRPHHSLARGMAALFLMLVAACAPPLEQSRLPGDGGLRTVEQMHSQSQQYARMGRTALDAGDVNSAAGLFEQAMLLDGDNAEAALGLGDALLRQNRPQEASEVYGRAFFQGGARAHYGYGRAMVALGRPETAIEHLKQAYDLAPTDPTVLNALGVAYDLAGQHDAAARAYREGLAMAPDDRGLKSNLGLSQALAGDTEAAIATLRPLAEGADSDKRARQNLALAYGLKGDVLAADRLSRVDLNEDEVRRNLAIFAALRGTDGAIAAMTLAPDLTAPSPPPKREPRQLKPMAAITSATQAPVTAPPPTPALEPAAPATSTPSSEPVPAPEAPPPRGPIPLTTLALDAGNLSVAALEVGSWFIRLGYFETPAAATEHWLQLRRGNPQALGTLSKLAGAGNGPEPLLAGPLADELAARTTCAQLRQAVPDCAPVQL